MASARQEIGNSRTTKDVSKGNIARAGSGPSRRSSSKAMIYGFIALAVAIAGSLFWFLLDNRLGSAAVGNLAETTLPIDTFVVNLGGNGQHAYLRVGITLGLNQPLPHDIKNVPLALVRDTILSVLATASPEQSVTPSGKQKLKADLLKALQEAVPSLGVINVYFTEFLVQM